MVTHSIPRRRPRFGDGPVDHPAGLTSHNGHTIRAGGEILTIVDCGPLIIPVPEQTRVGVTRRGDHFESLTLRTSTGAHIALTVYAVPRSGGYSEVLRRANHEVARSMGEVVERVGPWGIETVATAPDGSSVVCIAVEGERWILRSMAATRPGRELVDTLHLRKILSWSAVRRGDHPHPAGAVIPVEMPGGWTGD
ncbi:DUF3710 domain-containing protein [Rhodococcus sp. BS-15]|uniref:DUF3710 domain-containing protein n=1 Tax=Rhodococcus sp. BS-15 TaxID=1304954 RepID=UPI000FFB7354|nr:DUF3710 domain-containing protein [Rhodococcus sp. BS-15]